MALFWRKQSLFPKTCGLGTRAAFPPGEGGGSGQVQKAILPAMAAAGLFLLEEFKALLKLCE
jgi:hypothetical protein